MGSPCHSLVWRQENAAFPCLEKIFLSGDISLSEENIPLSAFPCLEKNHSSPYSSAFCIFWPSLVHVQLRYWYVIAYKMRCSTILWSLSWTEAGLDIQSLWNIPWVTSLLEMPKLKENPMGDINLGNSPACKLKMFPLFLVIFYGIVSTCLLVLPCFWRLGLWHATIWNQDLIMIGNTVPHWCARSHPPRTRI